MGADAQHIRGVVARRVGPVDVDVDPVVPGRRDEEVVRGVGDQRLQRDVVGAAAPRVVGDLDALVERVFEGRDRVGREPFALRVQEPQRHDLHVGGDTRDPRRVADLRGNGARDVRAVTVRVVRIGVPVGEVPAVQVVDVAVAVIVDAVRGDLALVDPHHAIQIRVGPIDARVDDTDDDPLRPCGRGPRRDDVDAGVALQPPLEHRVGVVGDDVRLDDLVGLGRLDDRTRTEMGESDVQPDPGLDHVDLWPVGLDPVGPDDAPVDLIEDVGDIVAGGTVAKRHENGIRVGGQFRARLQQRARDHTRPEGRLDRQVVDGRRGGFRSRRRVPEPGRENDGSQRRRPQALRPARVCPSNPHPTSIGPRTADDEPDGPIGLWDRRQNVRTP